MKKLWRTYRAAALLRRAGAPWRVAWPLSRRLVMSYDAGHTAYDKARRFYGLRQALSRTTYRGERVDFQNFHKFMPL